MSKIREKRGSGGSERREREGEAGKSKKTEFRGRKARDLRKE